MQQNQHAPSVNIYVSEGAQDVQSVSDNQQQVGESKTQYTDLEPVVPLSTAQNFYVAAETYTPIGNNYQYVSPNSREFNNYHIPSTNSILYKGIETYLFKKYFIV